MSSDMFGERSTTGRLPHSRTPGNSDRSSMSLFVDRLLALHLEANAFYFIQIIFFLYYIAGLYNLR